MSLLHNRYDFVLLFDVTNGNPNGDPDAGNLPRLDPESGCGLVTDVSLKRKVRNYVELARPDAPGYAIYVRNGALLNEQHRKAYRAVRPDDAEVAEQARLNPKNDAEASKLKAFMCANFFDVRAFGAVMSTGINCGQVRGPVQLTFAQSVEPIMPHEVSITRMAATDAPRRARGEAENEEDQRTDRRTMGRKHIVPYGLYRAHGFISANLAEDTGFTEDDLALLFEALQNMFDHDRSAARGEMTTRRLIVFKHRNALGNAPAHKLFDRVQVRRSVNGSVQETDPLGFNGLPPARTFRDYTIEIDRHGLTEGVEVMELA